MSSRYSYSLPVRSGRGTYSALVSSSGFAKTTPGCLLAASICLALPVSLHQLLKLEMLIEYKIAACFLLRAATTASTWPSGVIMCVVKNLSFAISFYPTRLNSATRPPRPESLHFSACLGWRLPEYPFAGCRAPGRVIASNLNHIYPSLVVVQCYTGRGPIVFGAMSSIC